MELACDPRALLGDGDACCRLALPLGLHRPCFGRLGLLGPLAEREAGEPGNREQDRDEDELAGRRLVRLVVDDDRHAADGDGQAQPRLHSRRGGCRAGTWRPDRRRRCSRRTRRAARRRTRARAHRSHTDAGAAKGKRRRASSGSTTSAVAGTVNHRVVRGASGESVRRPTSSALSTAASTISASNPYRRASDQSPPHAVNVLHSLARRLLPE